VRFLCIERGAQVVHPDRSRTWEWEHERLIPWDEITHEHLVSREIQDPVYLADVLSRNPVVEVRRRYRWVNVEVPPP